MATTTVSSTQTGTPARLVLNTPSLGDVKEQMKKDGQSCLGNLAEAKDTGYTVIPGVLPKQKALAYADKAYQWVESFGLGFDHNDPSTHTADKLHYFVRGMSQISTARSG
jgi:hypothetical protein